MLNHTINISKCMMYTLVDLETVQKKFWGRVFRQILSCSLTSSLLSKRSPFFTSLRTKKIVRVGQVWTVRRAFESSPARFFQFISSQHQPPLHLAWNCVLNKITVYIWFILELPFYPGCERGFIQVVTLF